MSELLEIFDINGKKVGVKKRKFFYSQIKREFQKTGKITKMVKTIRVVLMNSDGKIFLQKRSKEKRENAGLYDKTVGGHVPNGYPWDATVIKECAEELGFPVAIVDSKTLEAMGKSLDLTITGLLYQVDENKPFKSVRKTRNGEFIQPSWDRIYIGYFDGSIRFCDGEASGIELFTLDDLKKEVKARPEVFTEDIKFMIKKYHKYLKPLR